MSNLADRDSAAKPGRLIFGPVPSRRLGLSLGLDLVPRKTCTLDCLYCEVCRTTHKTITRADFNRSDQILSELKALLPELEGRLDFITLAGSGEPTLNTEIGKLIDGVKDLAKVPVAVLTNGTLFYLAEVRKELQKADLVIPSLDTAVRETFQTLNRPHPDLELDKIIQGLVTFRAEFSGQLWLEVLLVSGLNDTPRELESIKGAIDLIDPDLVQINTVYRPPAHPGIRALGPEELAAATRILGPKAEKVGRFSKQRPSTDKENPRVTILSMLDRRPCTISDVADALGLSREKVGSILKSLEGEGAIRREHYNGNDYFSRAQELAG